MFFFQSNDNYRPPQAPKSLRVTYGERIVAGWGIGTLSSPIPMDLGYTRARHDEDEFVTLGEHTTAVRVTNTNTGLFEFLVWGRPFGGYMIGGGFALFIRSKMVGLIHGGPHDFDIGYVENDKRLAVGAMKKLLLSPSNTFVHASD